MFDTNERVVEVSKQFYRMLAVAMKIEERWYDVKNKGIVLYVIDPIDGDSRKLIFTAREDATP